MVEYLKRSLSPRYNEGQFELSESRERLSTVTKKAVASLERVRDDQKPAPAQTTGASLIDFATFEDRCESCLDTDRLSLDKLSLNRLSLDRLPLNSLSLDRLIFAVNER